MNGSMHRPASAEVAALRRRALRILGLLLFGFFALLLTPRALYAGTVTIVDGPDAFIDANTFNDAYIQHYLNITGSLTIDTAAGTLGLPDDLRIAPGVEIAWTSGSSLTLAAQGQIVVSGTIQHDGPADGSGGVALLADGDVRLGLGVQPARITVGSRHGLTRVAGANMRLQGGTSGGDRSVQLGFHAVNQGAAYTVTGPISVTAAGSVAAAAGSGQRNFVQVGHGGAVSNTLGDEITDGVFAGDIAIVVGVDIFFHGGGSSAYAQVGNGGRNADGSHSGSHTLSAGGDIVFRAGAVPSAYTQVGNGGLEATGSHSGDHTLTAGGDIVFSGGGLYAYAQVGNGGAFVPGNHSGSHTFMVVGDIIFSGGDGAEAYAQAGNGGNSAAGNHSGDHTLTAGGDVAFSGGGSSAYAQVGNGGDFARGSHRGSHTLSVGRDITFAGDSFFAYAQVGNGGSFATGNLTGSHTLSATHTISFTGGGDYAYVLAGNGGLLATGSHRGNHTFMAGGDLVFTGGGDYANAQAGNGGRNADGSHSGDHLLTAGGDIVFQAGAVPSAYAQAGNGDGSGNSVGARSGDLTLLAGADLVVNGGHIGPVTASGALSITDCNTYIGVSQNNASATGAGQILATNTASEVGFTSAPAANGGELRFYVPEASNVTIPANTRMNSEFFPGVVPVERTVGVFLFDDGPYITEISDDPSADYAFYLAIPVRLFLPAIHQK
jgi:hypothetical protein